jgi:hypothetical protein
VVRIGARLCRPSRMPTSRSATVSVMSSLLSGL